MHAAPGVVVVAVAVGQHSWVAVPRLGGAAGAAAAAGPAVMGLWYSGSPSVGHCDGTCLPGGNPGGLEGYTKGC